MVKKINELLFFKFKGNSARQQKQILEGKLFARNIILKKKKLKTEIRCVLILLTIIINMD